MAQPVEIQEYTMLRAVTPTDTSVLPAGVTRSLWVGGSGNVAMILESDTSAVLLSNIAAGTRLPVKAKVVNSTSTTATLIVAMY